MRYEDGMMARHVTIEQLPYGKPVQRWLKDRYGETEANQIFMGPFTKLGKIFDLNRPFHMWLIDKVFRKSGNKRVKRHSHTRKLTYR